MSMFEPALTKDQYYELHEKMASYRVEPEPEKVTPVQNQATPKALDISFMARGRCKDLPPGYMFGQDSGEVEAAKAICRKCVVIEECAEYALVTRVNNGVWGGMSERERRAELKRRRVNGTIK